jgi:hypothetical protein
VGKHSPTPFVLATSFHAKRGMLRRLPIVDIIRDELMVNVAGILLPKEHLVVGLGLKDHAIAQHNFPTLVLIIPFRHILIPL